MLSVVDNRNFRRLMYEVLDHDPREEDIEQFLLRLKTALACRGLRVRGATTDGSPLYPGPLARVFGTVPHQVCRFHVIADLTRAVLRAVAKVRKALAARMPRLPVGRPAAGEARRVAARKRRLREKVQNLFEHRHLFVRRELTQARRRTLMRITRGMPELRTLRQVMEEVYRLFDRRCRAQTALAKLRKLRGRVRRFRKVGKTLQTLFHRNMEKALVFLDDSLLPGTSNAVERGNRRHRKMQKTVYSVRTRRNLVGRLALDLQRDQHREGRAETLQTMHETRTPRPPRRRRRLQNVMRLPHARRRRWLPEARAG